MQTKVLYEDRDILAVHKPAGIAVQTARIGQTDVVSELKNYLARTAGAAGRGHGGDNPGRSPYLGVVHRLDQPVEGVLVFAKTKAAAAGLSSQLAGEDFCKEYLAVVWSRPAAGRHRLVDYLAKDGGRAVIVAGPQAHKDGIRNEGAAPQAGPRTETDQTEETDWTEETDRTEEAAREEAVRTGKRAVLCYECLRTKELPEGILSLLRIELETGRFHQIRAQLSHAGFPILGDGKYGTAESGGLSAGLGLHSPALCACRLTFTHPVTKKKMEITTHPANRAFALLEE